VQIKSDLGALGIDTRGAAGAKALLAERLVAGLREKVVTALADPSYCKQYLERIEAHGYGALTNAQIKSDLAALGMSTKGGSKKVLADRLKDGLRDKVAAASEAAAASPKDDKMRADDDAGHKLKRKNPWE
jgi:hypothetical protein